jgi:hypothetical protein
MTKRGTLCKNIVGHIQQSAADWKALHREAACWAHGGERQ